MRQFVLVGVCFLALAGSAAAVRDPALEKSLKAQMVKTFKKQAPKLTITTVICEVGANSVTAHCTAHFTDRGVTGYYPVIAKLHDLGGTLSWTAQAPKCLNPKTKKYAAC